MIHFNFLIFSAVIVSTYSAPSKYRNFYSDESDEEFPWNSRAASYPNPSPISDEIEKLFSELEHSLRGLESAFPQLPDVGTSVSAGSGSESESDEDADDDSVPTFSIVSSIFGGSPFGGFDTNIGKDLKNKTTVETKVIDGHKYLIKDSTYVTDHHGMKGVIHINEVELAADDADRKKSVSTTTKPSVEDADKPVSSTPKPSAEDDETTSSQKPSVDDKETDVIVNRFNELENKSTTPKPTTEEPNESKEIDNNTYNSNEDNNDDDKPIIINSSNPNADVEEIDIEDLENRDKYYKYNTNDKLKNKEVRKN